MLRLADVEAEAAPGAVFSVKFNCHKPSQMFLDLRVFLNKIARFGFKKGLGVLEGCLCVRVKL